MIPVNIGYSSSHTLLQSETHEYGTFTLKCENTSAMFTINSKKKNEPSNTRKSTHD